MTSFPIRRESKMNQNYWQQNSYQAPFRWRGGKPQAASVHRTDFKGPVLWLGLVSALFWFAAGWAQAETPEEKGLAIAKQVDLHDRGFHDYSSELRMVLRNRHGEVSERSMRSRFLEMKDDGDKSLIIFDLPRDVKGTAFLSFTHKQGPDDQWLYLPALKRVKRISSNNKSGPFMGSEFAYEDISSQEVEKYTYKYIGDEKLKETDTFVVERFPVDRKSGYSKQVVWINKKEYRPEKIDFYDRKGDLMKTLINKEYHQYEGKFWRAHKMEMVNHITGKSTDLIFSDFSFRNGMRERDFDRASLARVR